MANTSTSRGLIISIKKQVKKSFLKLSGNQTPYNFNSLVWLLNKPNSSSTWQLQWYFKAVNGPHNSVHIQTILALLVTLYLMWLGLHLPETLLWHTLVNLSHPAESAVPSTEHRTLPEIISLPPDIVWWEKVTLHSDPFRTCNLLSCTLILCNAIHRMCAPMHLSQTMRIHVTHHCLESRRILRFLLNTISSRHWQLTHRYITAYLTSKYKVNSPPYAVPLQLLLSDKSKAFTFVLDWIYWY